MSFDESKHPRDKDGKFTDRGGNKGSETSSTKGSETSSTKSNAKGSESYADGVNKRIKWAKENNYPVPLNKDGSVNDVVFQKQYNKHHPTDDTFTEDKWKALENFVRRVINNTAKPNETFDLGKVSERTKADIEKLLNQKLSEVRHVLSVSAVRHIWNRHGENGTANRTMSEISDFKAIADILNNYDTVELARDKNGKIERSANYKTADNQGAPIVIFTKEQGNQKVVIEAVTDAKAGKLYVVTAY